MKKTISILILFIVIIEGCRYKEGPLFSILPVKSRLFGSWKVTEFSSDGIDSLQFYNDSCGCKMYIPTLSDEQDISFLGSQHNFYDASGFFSFSNHKKKINVSFGCYLIRIS